MQSAHVKDLLCLIRAAASHYDELAWMRYLTLYRGIGSVTAGRLAAPMELSTSLIHCRINWLILEPKDSNSMSLPRYNHGAATESLLKSLLQ